MSMPSRNLLCRLAARRGLEAAARPAPASVHFMAADGLQLHYLDWIGGPETLVLLHGGLLSAHTFDLLALAVGPAYRCVALDLRGHGESGWADEYPVDRSADDVCDLVGRLGASDVHLVGMSLGGCVAGYAAAQLDRRLASLTFVDVGARVDFEAIAGMRAFLEPVRSVPSVEDLVAQALRVSSNADADLLLYRYQSMLRGGPDGFVWRADRRRPTDFAHILDRMAALPALAPAIQCPVLVARGGRSRVLTDATAAAFAGAFRSGRSTTIQDASHNVQEDAPVALAAAIIDLIATARSVAA